MSTAIAPPLAPAAPALHLDAERVEIRETHASWVFLAGADAYKVKKPVRLAFLDYSTLARRRAACREELRVNRELAPSVYLDVRALVPAADGGLRLAGEDAPQAVEYAVHMRRFDEAHTLHGVIQAGALTRAQLRQTGTRLAEFHRHAPPVSGGEPTDVLETWLRNLDELERTRHPGAWRMQTMRGFAQAFVAAHAGELRRRARDGHVRDGHGDLRCEHVLLDRAGAAVEIVDRIEFDPTLRHLDVACDLAFLMMDLEAHRRRQAARELVSAYRHAGGSPGSEHLRSFYAAYWALVRAKVALIAAAGAGGADAPRERARAARLWRLAERLCWQARRPLAIVVCGAPASGKSTLAAELSRRGKLPVVSSDVVRKRHAGVAVTERAAPQHYSRAFTRETYELLSRDALAALQRGGGVIVDASCHSRRERASLFRRLERSGAGLLVVQCQATLATTLARAAARTRSAERISDATPAIAAERLRRFQAIDELPAASVLSLDSERPLAEQVDALSAALDERLASLAVHSE